MYVLQPVCANHLTHVWLEKFSPIKLFSNNPKQSYNTLF